MDKVTKFLEKHVQWVALALGGLFLVWMIYGNIVQKPVVVSVGGKELTPGEVDPLIADGPAKQLDAAMRTNVVPDLHVNDFNATLTANLGTSPAAYAQLSTPWSGIPLPSAGTVAIVQQTGPVQVQVTQLPVVPALVDLQISQGRSNVLIPDPPAAPGAAPGNGAGTPMDKNWVSVGATVPVKKLAAEFAAKNIPSGLNITTMLRVELIRQEQDSGGNWGGEKTVEPLLNVSLMPMPAQTAGVNQQTAYVQWAEKAQADLLRPSFYKVLQADPWRSPGTAAPEQVVADEPFDPAKVGNDLSKLSPEEMKMYQDYRATKEKEAREKAAARKGAAKPSPSGYPGAFPGEPSGPGALPRRNPPATPQPTRSPARPTAPPTTPESAPAPFFRPGMPMGGIPGYPIPGMPGMPGNGAPADPVAGGVGVLPVGSFDVTSQADFSVWAHDDSVEPGKNYRYKLRYIIKSPVFQTFNVCNPQMLSATFALQSVDSDWTKPVNVQSETNFYAVNTFPSQSKATFEIFRWKNGAWQKQRVEVHPGDMIGGPEGDGANKVDFTTGWTLVDVREDPQNTDRKIIILTTSNGTTSKHDLAVDLSNPEYKRLNDQATSAAAAGARTSISPP